MKRSNSSIQRALRLHDEVRRLTREVQRMDRELCAPHGLSPAQWQALLEIERSNSANMNELAQRLCIHRSTLTRLVDQLEKKSLVRRLPDTSDRRQTLLESTEPGRTLCEEILQDSLQAQREVGFGLPSAEWDEASDTLAQLAALHERWNMQNEA